MLSSYRKLLASLNKDITLTAREAVLCTAVIASSAVACAMTGMVVGMLISPRKHTTIGSHNGSNNSGNSGAFAPSAEMTPEASAEEIEE